MQNHGQAGASCPLHVWETRPCRTCSAIESAKQDALAKARLERREELAKRLLISMVSTLDEGVLSTSWDHAKLHGLCSTTISLADELLRQLDGHGEPYEHP